MKLSVALNPEDGFTATIIIPLFGGLAYMAEARGRTRREALDGAMTDALPAIEALIILGFLATLAKPYGCEGVMGV